MGLLAGKLKMALSPAQSKHFLYIQECTTRYSRDLSLYALTLQNPTFVFIRAKYFLLCEVSASGPVSRIMIYDLPFPPTERSNPSYLQVE